MTDHESSGAGRDPEGEAAPPPGLTLLDVAPGWASLREARPGGGPQGPWVPFDRWLDRVAAEDRAGVGEAVAAALAGPTAFVATFRAGSGAAAPLWMQLSGVPGEGAAGPGWTGALVDVTASVRAAEARARRGDAEALLRTRNTLAAIRAILRLDVGPGASAADLASTIDGRVGALARVLVGFGQDAPGQRPVEAILRDELVAAAVRDEAVRVDGPPVALPFRPAQVMALAFHDLLLASCQGGALAHPGGRLDVAWRVERPEGGPVEGPGAASALLLDWDERAPGLPASAPGAPTLGLVGRMLAYDGGGRAEEERRAGRRTCRIRLSLGPGRGPGPEGGA